MVNARVKKKAEFYKKRRERKFDLASTNKGISADLNQLNLLSMRLTRLNNEIFDKYRDHDFPLFRSNLLYVQLYSGLNKLEFSSLANISNHALSDKVFKVPTTLPIHTFLKSYSIMLHYIPSIEFCDMFSIDFSKAYPWHKDNLNANRIKMGKKPLKNI
jgi:hypothetical protein